MAKKKAGKVIQMLSPENYIRTKARALPIYECLVNPEWKEGGFANIIVARSHTNGNITLCIYLIDLYCLGVKDSYYKFNILRDEYLDILHSSQITEPIPISYTLVHNIIYAGLEHAEELGFKPHKDFTSITRFMLEEDTEDVELIEIECGRDGKPLYVSGPFDDERKKNAVIKQLEKTVGVGNFDYITSSSDDEFDREKEDDEDWEKDDFDGFTFEDKKKLFLDLGSRAETLTEEEAYNFSEVSDSIFKDITDEALFDKYLDEFNDELDDIELIDDEIFDEFLGVLPGTIFIEAETRNLFLKILNEIEVDTGSARNLWEKFKKQTPDIPASYFLELMIFQKEDSKIFFENLEEYANKFPDYPLIKLLFLIKSLSSKISHSENIDQTISFNSVFQKRAVIHTIELIHFFTFYLLYLAELGNPSRLEAFICYCEGFNLQDENTNDLYDLLDLSQKRLIHKYLTQ